MTNNAIDAALAAKVLDASIHARLIQNLGQYAQKANVPESVILSSMVGVCSEFEIAWFKSVRKNEIGSKGAGLLYTGELYPPAIERMMMLTGGFLRNFIDARILALKEVVEQHKELYEAPTVLVIPNFSITKGAGVNWDAQMMLGLLMRRMAAKKYTILYSQSKEALVKEYGKSMGCFIEDYYSVHSEED